MPRVTVRSSLRSRESSSTSTGPDPRERVKDCCRKVIAFMCTQVGVGGLVVSYAIVGAFGFILIETQEEYAALSQIAGTRKAFAEELWTGTAGDVRVNVLDRKAFLKRTDAILKRFQERITLAAKEGYDGRSAKEIWTFPAALMFCLSVFTMIGYGNMVPKTPWGKGVTVMYAVLGIPLYVLYFLNMGKILAQVFRWLYRWTHECSGGQRARITVPSTACLWVLFGYVIGGAIMFGEWEGWNYLDSAYFCVTSLCKIGIGDFVPGARILEPEDGSQTKLVINFVYLLLGMGLIAMCYDLMREDVRVKAKKLKNDVTKAMAELRIRMLLCCGMDPE
ncbi:potassium channel subfamily K member 15 [Orussus abietinus]|uniref:potassium channel subfamily K member 15 n=1 Tax=Orussus abietinus TaxID=222816 RepID=UPI000626E11F|nr:potassium channel subfamily K member 15 [Orussus abietinus]